MAARFLIRSRVYAGDLAFTQDPARKCAPGRGLQGIWFSDGVQAQETARNTCRDCPVLNECLTYALTAGERFGVWGGVLMSDRDERRRALRSDNADPYVATLTQRGLTDGQIAARLDIDVRSVQRAQQRLRLTCGLEKTQGQRRRPEVAA